MAPPQHLSPRPTSVSTPHQYQPALTPTRRSPFGNFGATGCQAPSATRPVPLPFPHGGMMFSDRLDSPASDYSWGNPAPPVTFEPLPDIRIKRSESSSSSSSGSSTLIDLQAQWNSDPLNAGKTTAAASLLSFGLLSDPSTASTPRRHGHGDALVVVAPPGPRSDASLPKAPPQQVPPPVPPLPAGAVKFSTAELARFVLNSDNLYGTKDITATTRQIAGVSTKHTAKCDSLLKMIFTLLANHPSPEMQYLAQDVEDPDTGLTTKNFWLHLSGEPTEAKKQLLNAILVIFSHWYRKVEYRTRTISEMSPEEIAAVRSMWYFLLFPVFFNLC